MGGFTDLFVVDVTTDLDDADTAETLNLLALNIGDIVFPQVALDVKTNVDGPSLTAATGSVGVTGAVTQLTAASNLLAAGNEHFVPGAAVGAYATVAADIYLVLDFALTGCNAADLTAGEIWVWANISRKADRLTGAQA